MFGYPLFFIMNFCYEKKRSVSSRGATKILLKGEGGLKMEIFCDVILMTYFR